jgi:hypothetical protein
MGGLVRTLQNIRDAGESQEYIGTASTLAQYRKIRDTGDKIQAQ